MVLIDFVPQLGQIEKCYFFMEVMFMKRGSTAAAFFTGIFVAVMAFLSDFLLPDLSIVIGAVIIGLSAIIGGLIGTKLFPKEL